MRSGNGILLLASALMFSAGAWAAPKKAAKGSSKPAVAAARPETVYVTVNRPREAHPAPQEIAREPDARRSESSVSSPLFKDFRQSYGVYLGFYAAELLGSNPYVDLYYDLFPRNQPFFFEFTAGFGTAQTDYSKRMVGGTTFENNYLVIFEGLGGYGFRGFTRGDGRSAGVQPYIVAGIAAVYQGGVPNVAGVLGFGNRLVLPFGSPRGRWELNYGMRDHIFSQKIRTEPSLTQNFVLLLGAQMYY